MRLALLLSITLILASLVAGTALGQSCGCQVSDRKEAAYNALLILDSTERAISAATHLAFGIPATAGATNERLSHTSSEVAVPTDCYKIVITDLPNSEGNFRKGGKAYEF